MDTQVNFLALITSALNTYIEQQVNAALAKAAPPTVDVDQIQALVDAAVGAKITELFEARIGEMIDEKMESVIEDAIEQHKQSEQHDIDTEAVVDAVVESRAFDRALERAVEDVMDAHTSDYDHDKLAEMDDKLSEDEIDEKLQDFVQRDEIKDLVGTALSQTTFRLTSTAI